MPIRESENSLELHPSGYFELIVILFLGLGLIILGITRFIIIRSGQISTVIFNESGIVFQNVKQVILSSLLWKEIEGITICQWDDEKNLVILCIITKKSTERIDLKKYDTISTTCEVLWEKIYNFYDKYKPLDK